MITVTTGIIIVIYCLYNLLLIDIFMDKMEDETNWREPLMFIAICIWFVIHFFFQSGIICALVFIPMFFTLNYHPKRKERLYNKIMLITIAVIASFVILNKLWFNFNLWTFNII